MKASQMMPSKFLKKEDVEQPMLLTVKALGQADVSQQDEDADLKWTLKFKELDKPMVLNVSNINACTEAFGTDETEEWIGKQIVLYVDANVMFGGKKVGGLRLRAPKRNGSVPIAATSGNDKARATEAASKARAFEDSPDPNDEIPF